MGRFEDADETEDAAEQGRRGGDGGASSSVEPAGPSSSSSAPGRHRRTVRATPGTGLLSKALAVVVGFFFFAIGTRYSHWFGRLTPVYAKVQCWSQAANLEEFVVGAKAIHMGLVVNITCANPNPYPVLVQPILGSSFGGTTGAEVYIGTFPMALRAGRFVIAATELPAGSGGLVQALASVDLRGPDAEELLPHFLEDDKVPVTMQMEFLVLSEVRLGLAKFQADALFKEDCGLHVRGLFSRSYEPKTGMSHAKPPVSPMVCGKTWATISRLMPEVDEDSPGEPGADGEDFMGATLSSADARRASLTKYFGLGTLIVFSYFFGAVGSAFLWFIGGPWDRQAPAGGGYKSPGAAAAPPPLEQQPAGAPAAAGDEERMMTKGLMEREDTAVADAAADEEMKRFVDVT